MAENMLDVFNGDAFSVVSLTDAINNLIYVPGRIGELGIFESSGVTNTTVAIEQKGGILALIPPTPRGGPGVTLDKARANIRDVRVPHFEIMDAVMAEEVQGVRQFGSGTAIETVSNKVAERLSIHSQSMEATSEYSRMGAIKGVVTYADGTTLDLFQLFGVTQIAEVDFDLDNASPAAGALRKKCASVIRTIATELDGIPWSGGVRAFCGDAFFDDLLAHTEVRTSYLNQIEARILRDSYLSVSGKIYGAFDFGGIIWENYRGVVGGTPYINTDKCHLFPMGVPQLFKTYWAPADYNETVNTVGVRIYAKQYAMPNGKGIHLDSQMNELNIATRPRVLIQGKRT